MSPSTSGRKLLGFQFPFSYISLGRIPALLVMLHARLYKALDAQHLKLLTVIII